MSEGAGDSGSDNGHNATKKANLTPLRVGSGDSSRDKSGKSSKGIDSRGSRSSGPSNNSRGSTPGSGATGDGGFLNKTIDAVLKAYDAQKGKANITGQAAELMTPEVIEKMKTIKFQIDAHFM